VNTTGIVLLNISIGETQILHGFLGQVSPTLGGYMVEYVIGEVSAYMKI